MTRLLFPLLLSGLAVAAPNKPSKEGLLSHEEAGKRYVIIRPKSMGGAPGMSARLVLKYVVAGRPAETYAVELWMRPADGGYDLYHFDTQEVTVSAGEGLQKVKGKFDRTIGDRDHL